MRYFLKVQNRNERVEVGPILSNSLELDWVAIYGSRTLLCYLYRLKLTPLGGLKLLDLDIMLSFIRGRLII